MNDIYEQWQKLNSVILYLLKKDLILENSI